MVFPYQDYKSMVKFYGNVGENTTSLILPYPMKLAWDKSITVNKISCHKLVAEGMLSAITEELAVYGLQKIQELEMDIYGGCFNFRKMRGGNEMSRHAWGIAIDRNPEKNKLKDTGLTAQFAKPDYKKMMEIWYKHGFINLGVEKNYDFMHFEYNGVAL